MFAFESRTFRHLQEFLVAQTAPNAAAASSIHGGGSPAMTEAQSEEQVVDALKGKAPEPPTPAAPKPEPWMYKKTSDYAMVHAARKK